MATVPLHPEVEPLRELLVIPDMNPEVLPIIRETPLGEPHEPSEGVVRSDHVIDEDTGVFVRVHRPADAEGPLPCLYHLHGGGYIIGSVDLDDARLDHWVSTLGIVAVSVEYRLAPEHPFPTPLEDCYAGLAWVAANAAEIGVDVDKIGIGGVSAGGGLCAALAMLVHDRGEVSAKFQVLDCPMIDDRQETPSSQLDDLLIWSTASNTFGWQSHLGDLYGTNDIPPAAAVARAADADLAGLPPALISAGGADGVSRRGHRLRPPAAGGGCGDRSACLRRYAPRRRCRVRHDQTGSELRGRSGRFPQEPDRGAGLNTRPTGWWSWPLARRLYSRPGVLIEQPNRPRRYVLAVAPLLLALVLAACGGDDGASDDAAGADETTTTDDGQTNSAAEEADSTDADESSTDDETGTTEATDDDGATDDGADATADDDTAATGITAEITEDPVDDDLVDRFAEALPATGDDVFVITAEDGRCAAEGLDGRLDEAAYKSLTDLIEANESIEPDDGLGTAEIEVIANVFAVCLDFAPLIPDFAGDLGPESEPLVACLEAEIGEQGLEEAMLFEILADNLDDSGSRFYTTGFESCPDETVTNLGATAADWVGVPYDAALATCLDDVPVADYEALLADGGPFATTVTEAFLADNCGV